MPLYKRPGSPHWWVRISVSGQKTRRTTGTADRSEAEEFEQRERERLWRLHKLGDRGAVRFAEASARWLTETQKRSKVKDEYILDWFDGQLKDEPLSSIDADAIEELRQTMAEEGKGKSNIDRYMALLSAVLRKAAGEWRMLEKAPKVPMYRPEKPEPRWLTKAEYAKLRKELPEHLQHAADIAVLTGLRMRAMLGLTWERVNLQTKRLWVPGSGMKAGRTHGIPISAEACAVLRKLKKQHPKGHVFQWRDQPIDDVNGKAFQDAVERSGVGPLRWHDLRHTFASWAVQSGVTLHELMQLGGWSSYQMVIRYAHLAPDHLASAAAKVSTKAQRKRAIIAGK